MLNLAARKVFPHWSQKIKIKHIFIVYHYFPLFHDQGIALILCRPWTVDDNENGGPCATNWHLQFAVQRLP